MSELKYRFEIICDSKEYAEYLWGALRGMIRDARDIGDIQELNRRAPEAGQLCSDCPPIDYPTDETRCIGCPRRKLTKEEFPYTFESGHKNRIQVGPSILMLLADETQAQAEPVAEPWHEVPEDSIDRLTVGKGTEGDQMLVVGALQSAEIYADLYWEFTGQIEPFVQRIYKVGAEDMPLPASLHGAFNILFDHWLKDQECYCLDAGENSGRGVCEFCRIKSERGIPLYTHPQQPAEPQARIKQLEDCLRHIGMDLEILGLDTDDVEVALGGRPLQTRRPAVPNGWKLVPIEPAQAMLTKMREKHWEIRGCLLCEQDYRDIYSVFIAAAPGMGEFDKYPRVRIPRADCVYADGCLYNVTGCPEGCKNK